MTDDLESVLQETRQRFIARFPGQCDAIEVLIDDASAGASAGAIAELRQVAHRLAGLAGTLGFPVLSLHAGRLELACAKRTPGFDSASARAELRGMREAFGAELTNQASWSAPDVAAGPEGTRVLLAEDDPDQQLLVATCLRRAGYVPTVVDSGDVVLAVAREARPAIIILESDLPGVDGFAVCRLLKADPELSGIPVIFLAAGANVDDRLAGLMLGADEFLAKPVDMRELILRIAHLLKRCAPADAPSPGAVSRSAGAAKILIADDDPDVTGLVDAQMRAAGYETFLAFDGEQAMTLIAAHDPDVVVLGLLLPRLTGFEILAQLQAVTTRPRVIVLSALSQEDDVTRAFELGADDYMTKPFSPQELMARVARLLR
ncbi:MAG: response regulator [Acidobacteriota bacterium]|nr:response regulator [Acidobacteriota bacterium]